ncbi:SH3 domain-containing protein [Golovinomyces cichoracearum]|uniref:SH3 domain-containing protein n=1 Tax=Golovinomyces cichoracearum TaxID=62708 RepID=A0A420I5S8_9PEZI|nr:SH3 domain-containing protein [Golovinomyces cichoracearum]
MRVHNPLPSNMEAECLKCSKILASFIDPGQAYGLDKFIPSSVLANAKGLAILTVFKAGFLGSARYGNGIVVARLSDGRWSAPSAIGTGGAGFGGQIGFEWTDFVFILNDSAAVRTFSQMGSLTLGGNLSVAAGPVGRNAEAAGAASLKSMAGIFSYSRTKGLFAGISLEGSVIMERRDANEKLYGRRYTAHQLLSGSVPPPPAAQPLIKILNSRAFANSSASHGERTSHHPPSAHNHGNGQAHVQKPYHSHRKSSFRENYNKFRTGRTTEKNPENTLKNRHSMDGYNSRPNDYTNKVRTSIDGYISRVTKAKDDQKPDNHAHIDTPKPYKGPERNMFLKQAPLKPMFPSLSKNEAIALLDFESEQPGDLSFKKGDIITVTQSSGSQKDWWTGITGHRTGIFPANYVEMKK